MFKNMKIEITDEAHLKAVCDALSSTGYKCDSTAKTTIVPQGKNITDNVTDIRNHLSPHTVVIDL